MKRQPQRMMSLELSAETDSNGREGLGHQVFETDYIFNNYF